MALKVCQHRRSKPPTNAEARWPSQTHFFDEYQGEISRATVHWACLRVCVCVFDYVWMWLIIIIWTDCRLHALLLPLHTHYFWGHAARYSAACRRRSKPYRTRFKRCFTSCSVRVYCNAWHHTDGQQCNSGNSVFSRLCITSSLNETCVDHLRISSVHSFYK